MTLVIGAVLVVLVVALLVGGLCVTAGAADRALGQREGDR